MGEKLKVIERIRTIPKRTHTAKKTVEIQFEPSQKGEAPDPERLLGEIKMLKELSKRATKKRNKRENR